MDDKIKNLITEKIENELDILQKGILDVNVQKDKSGNDIYSFDLIYSFYTIDDLLKKLITEVDKGTLLYNIFSIEEQTVYGQVDFYNDDFDSPKDNPHISTLASIVFKELKTLSCVSNLRFYIINCGEKHYLEDYDKVIDSHREYIDSFNSRLLLKIAFDYHNCTIDSNSIFENLEVESVVYGIRNNNSVPLWVEYIINSFILFRAGNKELALFTAFASLDCFIEILNDICVETYKEIKINGFRLEDFSKYYNKLEEYKNANRRLVKEKLKTILKDIKKDEACKDIFDYLAKVEKKRNNIAHCNDENKYVEYDYENFMVNYLKLLYMLKFDKGIEIIFNFL